MIIFIINLFLLVADHDYIHHLYLIRNIFLFLFQEHIHILISIDSLDINSFSDYVKWMLHTIFSFHFLLVSLVRWILGGKLSFIFIVIFFFWFRGWTCLIFLYNYMDCHYSNLKVFYYSWVYQSHIDYMPNYYKDLYTSCEGHDL